MNIVNWNAFVHLLFVNTKTNIYFLKMPQSVGVYVLVFRCRLLLIAIAPGRRSP
uniref:Uncharacterized protein n=2 Tax=Anguilla anguilla TaxID=7936 RepID=A0A0E9R1J1_ANGAN